MPNSDLLNKTIDSDIRIARTLPTKFYTDPKYFEEAREKIFTPSWQFITDTDQVKTPGQAVPMTVLEGYLNEPILLTCDSAQQFHALSNVCTHRGNLLVEAECHTQQLRCRYHGRRFALDGSFVSTPGFEDALDFPSKEDNLPQVPTEKWGKFIFSSVNPAYPLADLIGDMKRRLDWLPLADFHLDAENSRDYEVQANWALYIENYLEGFHIPYVHPSLAVLLDTKNYRTELHKHGNLQIGIAQRSEDAFNLPESSPDYGQLIGAYYYWLFPNTIFNFYPWGLSLNVIVPLAHNRTRIRFLTYVWDRSRMAGYSIEDIDKTEMEDESIISQVQKGIQSHFYTRGRYSPQWETGVHQFHNMLHDTLAPEQ